MSVKVKGLPKLLAQLEQKLGQQALQRISDKALIEAANEFVKVLKQEFEKFKDTGASIEEITITGPYWENGVRTIKVHWRGQMVGIGSYTLMSGEPLTILIQLVKVLSQEL